jgi:hypothetical protein
MEEDEKKYEYEENDFEDFEIIDSTELDLIDESGDSIL